MATIRIVIGTDSVTEQRARRPLLMVCARLFALGPERVRLRQNLATPIRVHQISFSRTQHLWADHFQTRGLPESGPVFTVDAGWRSQRCWAWRDGCRQGHLHKTSTQAISKVREKEQAVHSK